MDVVKPITLDMLPTNAAPALSSVSDVPVIETKPDSVAEEVKAAPETPEDAAEGTTTAESATAETEPGAKPPADDEPEGDKPKAKGVQKRLDELTKQREDANRRAEAAEQRLDRALAALEKQTGEPAKEVKQEMENADPEPVKPDKVSFNDLDQYETALLEYSDQKAAWVARREVKADRAEQDRLRTEKAIKDEQQRIATTYQERVATLTEKYGDFKEVAYSPQVQVSPVMAQAIIHDEHGAELQYFFGKNPDEAKRIMSLNPFSQVIEMGKIVAAMQTPAAKAESAEPAAAKPNISAAPKPIKPVSGAPSADAVPSSKEPSMDEYAAMRRKQEGWGDPQAPRARPTRH